MIEKCFRQACEKPKSRQKLLSGDALTEVRLIWGYELEVGSLCVVSLCDFDEHSLKCCQKVLNTPVYEVIEQILVSPRTCCIWLGFILLFLLITRWLITCFAVRSLKRISFVKNILTLNIYPVCLIVNDNLTFWRLCD